MKLTNINWDTDGEDIDLPNEVEAPNEIVKDFNDEEELLDYLSDWLSDEYGFCHDGFNIEH